MSDYRDQDRQEILSLKSGEQCYLNMCEGGGAQVDMVGDEYELYEIPMYGGEPRFYGIYTKEQIEEMLDEIYSWT